MKRALRSHGFTLIEVLAVGGVVGVLVSLALPVLRRSMDAGRSTVCLANLRTMGQGLELYKGAWDGRLPMADRLVDVRRGARAPLAELSRLLDVDCPVADGTGAVVGSSCFVCPQDVSSAKRSGWSYYYTPCDLMGIWPSSDPQRDVSRYLLKDPMTVLVMDDEPCHGGRRDGEPLSGRQGLCADGSARVGSADLSINPR